MASARRRSASRWRRRRSGPGARAAPAGLPRTPASPPRPDVAGGQRLHGAPIALDPGNTCLAGGNTKPALQEAPGRAIAGPEGRQDVRVSEVLGNSGRGYCWVVMEKIPKSPTANFPTWAPLRVTP